MKIGVLIACVVVYSIITTLLQTVGISLGAIPIAVLFGFTVWIAKKLSGPSEQPAKDETEE